MGGRFSFRQCYIFQIDFVFKTWSYSQSKQTYKHINRIYNSQLNVGVIQYSHHSPEQSATLPRKSPLGLHPDLSCSHTG